MKFIVPWLALLALAVQASGAPATIKIDFRFEGVDTEVAGHSKSRDAATGKEVIIAPSLLVKEGQMAEVKVAHDVTIGGKTGRKMTAESGVALEAITVVAGGKIVLTGKFTNRRRVKSAGTGSLVAARFVVQETYLYGPLEDGKPTTFSVGDATQGRERVTLTATRVAADGSTLAVPGK